MSVLSFAQRVFPTPRIISFPCVGVDISDTSLKYIQFERPHTYGEELLIKHWGDIDVPSGIVERGSVHDEKKLAAILEEVRDKCDAQYVNISLPEERAYLFETTISANTPRKDVRGLLEFKLEENVPLSPRDAYFDYAIVGEDAKNHLARVAVAVYARSTINSYYEACVSAGLIPLSFEIEAQAIARSTVARGLTGTYLIVDFGKTRMGVGIVHQGMLMYTSTIEIAGNQMSEDMRAILGNVPESELTTIKNTKGLVRMKDNESIAKVLEKYAGMVADELGIRIHYWDSRGIDPALRQIQKIIICGGSANLLGLPEYLESKLDIPTERAQVWRNVFPIEKHIPPITRRYSYGYATAIGLALRNFMHI